MANTRLTRSAATPTSAQKATMSFWIKRSALGSAQLLIDWYEDSSNYTRVSFNDSDVLIFLSKDGDNVYGQLTTNRVFRDTNAWYNIIVAIDTTQGTASNRMKMYINGVQETSFSTETQPVQNRNFKFDAAKTVGSNGASGEYYNGSMSHVNYIDGTQELPTAFGETDSTTGQWKIKTSPSVTYGNNGFFILKDGNSVTDQSGNSNNFTVAGGTLTKSEDSPDNVFATMNPLDNYFPNFTFSNGNTTVTTGGNFSYPQATIYVNTGKFYWECKPVSKAGGGEEYMIGIQGRSATAINQPAQTNNGITIYANDGDTYGFGGGATTYAAAYTAGDIIGVALDCDNNKLYFSKNGAWSTGSGAWGSTTFNSSTGALTITDPNDVPQGGYSPVAGFYDSPAAVFNFNFGNGTFGTTAVTSAGTNASGNGIFEYDVPTGFTALTTKGLNL